MPMSSPNIDKLQDYVQQYLDIWADLLGEHDELPPGKNAAADNVGAEERQEAIKQILKEEIALLLEICEKSAKNTV